MESLLEIHSKEDMQLDTQIIKKIENIMKFQNGKYLNLDLSSVQ
jgi:hypothetical protein